MLRALLWKKYVLHAYNVSGITVGPIYHRMLIAAGMCKQPAGSVIPSIVISRVVWLDIIWFALYRNYFRDKMSVNVSTSLGNLINSVLIQHN
jgi:hypothetical protein